MILLAAIDLERAIDLLIEQKPHHLMREGHRRKRESKVGVLSHRRGNAERAADEKREVALPLKRESGDLFRKRF